MESNLSKDLSKQLDRFNQTATDERKTLWNKGIDEVKTSGILENALNVGDTAPDFMLTDQLGREYSLYSKLKQQPVILIWYRGGWCPYCNLTLHHMQTHLPEFQKLGADLLALTPELPDQSLDTTQKQDLEFTVLSDVGNEVAKSFGVVFKLNPDVAKIYQKSFGLHEVNGDESEELPLAATYIIDQLGTIQYAFLHEDYRVRAEPEEIITALQKLMAKEV